MEKISIITPSVRPEGLKLVEKALRRQTFEDFEWLINNKRYEGGFFGLNRAYNDLIRQSKGELLISWQDYTFVDPDCLEKFWAHYQTEPKTLVTAVGNKYTDEFWMVKTWQDPRERDDQGSYYQCFPWDIEANLCSMPKSVLYDIGGFDEQMDFEGYGFDARGVFERLELLGGYDFKIDQSIKSYSLEHGRLKDWDKYNMINKWEEYKKKNIDSKRYPVLQYLDSKDLSEKESLT